MKEYITKIFNPVQSVDNWLNSFKEEIEIVGHSYADFGLIVTVRIDRSTYKLPDDFGKISTINIPITKVEHKNKKKK